MKKLLMTPLAIAGALTLHMNGMEQKPANVVTKANAQAPKALEISADKPEIKAIELPKAPTPPAVSKEITPKASEIGIAGGTKKAETKEIKAELPTTAKAPLFADIKELEQHINKTMVAAEQYVQKNPKEREKVLDAFENIFAAMIGGLVKVAGEDFLKAMEAQAQQQATPAPVVKKESPAKKVAEKPLSADQVFYNQVEADSQE